MASTPGHCLLEVQEASQKMGWSHTNPKSFLTMNSKHHGKYPGAVEGSRLLCTRDLSKGATRQHIYLVPLALPLDTSVSQGGLLLMPVLLHAIGGVQGTSS